MNRTWLITGASRGLGLALGRWAARSHANLVVCARSRAALENAAREFTEQGGRVEAAVGDVSDPKFCDALFRAAEESFGGVDVLVNNASILGPSPRPSLDTYPVDRLADVYSVNTLAPLRLIQRALPAMRRKASGVIVNVTSDAGVEGYPGWGGYGSSKAALELLSKTLHEELAETGIDVIAVDPGDMRTHMHRQAFPGEDISDRPSPETVAPAIFGLIEASPRRCGPWRVKAQEIATGERVRKHPNYERLKTL